jgi:cytochrome b
MSQRVRVWDLPTRVFHWALVLSMIGLVVTSQIGGNAMQWHFKFGYAVLSLLLFRIIWGLIGGRWSRFVSFSYPPSAILGYWRGEKRLEYSVGHSPVAAGSVFAMLLALLAQVVSGLMSDDEIAAAGPMTQYVSGAIVSLSTGYHKEVGKFILIALVLLHLAAIGFYFFKKKVNLVSPMIHGDKTLPASISPSRCGGVRSLCWRCLVDAATGRACFRVNIATIASG